ncbi:hypothetical protein CMQ_611 [Grosmannia clavigera kw1407]|uniref:Uncharacterized protein n=1 Tax=Grosmannia clavigera (strain kw1407 / UAMH 11150) TaxID=655863 RepID=F0XDQ5_GROCL|nr:uncharacterized protein CMQ_611 [Grosmannia clavigera kw1407]EFX03683.1 hypothetical protein CMQ_611 [Grosmannia clavigera kw1407]
MASRKPTLVLTTPVSATFPAEALKSAASVRTPYSALWRESKGSAGLPSAGLPSAGLPSAGLPSAGLSSAGLRSPMVAVKTEDGLLKTPITPPLAYTDFLKLASPVLPSPSMSSPTFTSAAPASRNKSALNPTSSPPSSSATEAGSEGPKKATTRSASDNKDAAEPSTDADADTETTASSNNSSPLTAASSASIECSCDCERPHKSPKVARIDTSMPPSPFNHYPISAPAIGRTTFPSMAMPISPAVSNANWTDSPVRSPFSAKSGVSHFDWESALKTRYSDGKPSPHTHAHAHGCAKAPSTSASRTSVRHIREVVTRTVTYTPRMNPPPKGKKRKAQCDGTACS